MDKNSLILEIKNDLNSIKKQVEVTLAKLTVLESMIELDKQLGAPVAEPVEAPVEELGVRSEELGISVQTSGEPSLLELSRVQPEITSEASNSESRDNACIVRDAEEVAEPAPEPIEVPVEIAKVAPIEEQKIEPKLDKESEKEDVKEELTPNSNVELRNLMSVIGLNDRFRFRHDLFSNSDEIFRETIDILTKIENFDSAVDYLMKKFEWDEEDATVVYFYDIIKPKF